MILHYDLHTHSSASDGILSPSTLVSRATDKGVTHLAITDHDTLAGLAEAIEVAESMNISFITGVEFSSQWQGLGIHLVGLNFDPQAESIGSAIEAQARTRINRAREIGERLAKVGIANAFEGASEIAGNSVVGRPHFAEFLVREGHVKDVNAAFKRYLGAGKIGDVKNGWLEPQAVIDAVRSAGGMTCLAHPLKYLMTLTKLRRLVEEFKHLGGAAIEVCSGAQTSTQTQSMAQLCLRFDLLASCGSDFHSPSHGWQELGAYAELPNSVTPIWHAWH